MFETFKRASSIATTAAAAIIAFPFGAAAAPLEPIPHEQQTPTDQVDESTMTVDRAALDTALLDACPIAGDHEFEDSWGWPRSGGRRHQGIDVGAERGTELYAVRDGSVDFKRSNLGGKALWLVTADGDRFYYAHLDGFVGDDREVEAGELIGYVGSTGNARGPHLHFETHPNGSVENPFPHVLEACSMPPARPLDAFLDRLALQQLARAAAAAKTDRGMPTVLSV